ncbi:unnamed protein product [Microthlaspi erraticum]|uniref:Neprosin activation peptide domain-containing protein n=1 Tax=Microthlaspi erraticum TaxID=1685480 RepID=A0A6D2IL99_9BRAS|nr:unnamed protein product [Microthlaspi erraticum]
MAIGKEMSCVAFIFLIMLISADARVLLQNEENQKSLFLQGATIARVTPGGPSRDHHYLQPLSEITITRVTPGGPSRDHHYLQPFAERTIKRLSPGGPNREHH